MKFLAGMISEICMGSNLTELGDATREDVRPQLPKPLHSRLHWHGRICEARLSAVERMVRRTSAAKNPADDGAWKSLPFQRPMGPGRRDTAAHTPGTAHRSPVDALFRSAIKGAYSGER